MPFIFHILKCDSVVDVGGGVGGWLAVFKRLGVQRILGIDEPWAKPFLQTDSSEFCAMDLTRPGKLSDRFDLVVSLRGR